MKPLIFLLALFIIPATARAEEIPGYRGIWFDLGQKSDYGSKYSGALGSYTAKHRPMAIYSPQANKTFFVYGGTPQADQRKLQAMIGAYDHRTDKLLPPVLVVAKEGVNDPHDNPSLGIDDEGYLLVFVSGRAKKRPGFIFKSAAPYAIDRFEKIYEGEFTYPQPWFVPGKGWIMMFTRYTKGRELYVATSPDGAEWSPARKIAENGHYQVSALHEGRAITAFNTHLDPTKTKPDSRTNLSFLQSTDFGATWTDIHGKPVPLPVDGTAGPSLVRNYQAEKRLVYLKDIDFDAAGRPVILYITSDHHLAGPTPTPRMWTIARWTGKNWDFQELGESDHNYNMGELAIDGSQWTLCAPLRDGPQKWGTGGEVDLWISEDAGRTWATRTALTRDSEFNHAYMRIPLNAHPEFFAFWSAGDPARITPCHLYYFNRTEDKVHRMPYTLGAGPSQ